MKKFVFLIGISATLCGCLSSNVESPRSWTVEYAGQPAAAAVKPAFGVARLSQVVVRAPYDVRLLAVLLSDGSVAFDGYNELSAEPAGLMKAAFVDAAKTSGLFERVIGPSSSAKAAVKLETTLKRLALDCRGEGRRALCEVSVRILRDDEIVCEAVGEGVDDAADGNYARSLSAAFTQAAAAAFGKVTAPK